MARLGRKAFVCLVVLTTPSVRWLPIDVVGPKNLVPMQRCIFLGVRPPMWTIGALFMALRTELKRCLCFSARWTDRLATTLSLSRRSCSRKVR